MVQASTNEEIRNQPSEEDLRNKEVFERIWSQTRLPLVTNGSSASGNLPATFRFLPGNLLVFFSAVKAPTLCASRMPSAKTNAITELPTASHLLCGGLRQCLGADADALPQNILSGA